MTIPPVPFTAEDATTALETAFPLLEISQVAEQESWRKEINRPLYHIHKWWATRLGSVFRAITLAALSPPGQGQWQDFYRQHNFTSKVVLDPFMGSGTTLGESLKLGAKAVGCDINPVSSFLVHQALTPVPEDELRTAFAALETEVAPQIRRYYQTRDPATGALIPIMYAFWVKVLDTPCGEEVPLFARYVFSQDAYPKKKPRAQIVCPSCWTVFEDRYDTAAATCAGCGHHFNPQQGPASGQTVTTRQGRSYKIKDLLPKAGPPRHRLYALMALRPSGEKIYLPARPEDRALYDEAAARLATEDLPLPTFAVRPGHNTDQARGYNYHAWRDFFNARQLLCLGLLLRAITRIEDRAVREQLLCLFSSTLEFNNLFCSFKGEGTGAVRHMFSNHILKPERTPLENSVWGTSRSSGTFTSLFESRLLRAKRYLAEPFELRLKNDHLGERAGSSKVIASAPIAPTLATSWDELAASSGSAALILNGNSASLPIPDKAVDAVITDPPYFDFVHYSELSDFFFAWLAPALKDTYPFFNREDSSADGEVQDKDPSIFAHHLGLVFAECRRVLKDEGVLAFSFHHSRPDGWAAIYRALSDAGLSVVAAHPVHAELRAASPKTAAKDPISLDAILVCRKQAAVHPKRYSAPTILAETDAYSRMLRAGGLSLSRSDEFVIAAAHALISAGAEDLPFVQMQNRLEELQVALGNNLAVDAVAAE
ncbi:putative DNA methylase [Paracoccus solventivorans]|uniref:site-specific DNA-methyltransferase (adenine-specific) n=1 Tax=Paracoccus solventivorans TaxID=53463 RepID=A0A1M7JUV9_9RHOB|nr:DNA methyltransferase [Paracoccus solventivorans]SHM56842.1 putative DNA methylase [Paracoccus solventivorans]